MSFSLNNVAVGIHIFYEHFDRYVEQLAGHNTPYTRMKLISEAYDLFVAIVIVGDCWFRPIEYRHCLEKRNRKSSTLKKIFDLSYPRGTRKNMHSQNTTER